jgi:hypothetical protein
MECDILNVWLSIMWALYTASVLGSGPERVSSKRRNRYGYVLIVTCFHSLEFGEEWELCSMLLLFPFVLTSGICFMVILT